MERQRPVNPEKKPVYGIFLFLTDKSGKVLVLTNQQNKETTQKIAGQLTTPAETAHPCENLIEDCLQRTIREEVGLLGDDRPHRFRGIVAIESSAFRIILVGYEKEVDKNLVQFRPEDPHEVTNPQWLPLTYIHNQTIEIGKWQVPLFRTPIPEFVSNILKARNGQRFPVVQRIKDTIPPEVFEFLENNSGS